MDPFLPFHAKTESLQHTHTVPINMVVFLFTVWFANYSRNFAPQPGFYPKPHGR